MPTASFPIPIAGNLGGDSGDLWCQVTKLGDGSSGSCFVWIGAAATKRVDSIFCAGPLPSDAMPQEVCCSRLKGEPADDSQMEMLCKLMALKWRNHQVFLYSEDTPLQLEAFMQLRTKLAQYISDHP